MYPALTDVVDMIHTGASARAIMCKCHISARKLERALNSVRLNKVLDLERRVQTAYLRFLVTRYLPKAVEGLADLAEYSLPETKRKACMALIAAATGINFAVPGASVYPEDVMESWRKLGGPEAAAALAHPQATAGAEAGEAARSDTMPDPAELDPLVNDPGDDDEEFDDDHYDDESRDTTEWKDPHAGEKEEEEEEENPPGGADEADADEADAQDGAQRGETAVRLAVAGTATCRGEPDGQDPPTAEAACGAPDGDEPRNQSNPPATPDGGAAIGDQNWQEVAESGATADTPIAQGTDVKAVTQSAPAGRPAKRGVAPRAHAGVPPAAKRGRSRGGAGAPPAPKRARSRLAGSRGK